MDDKGRDQQLEKHIDASLHRLETWQPPAQFSTDVVARMTAERRSRFYGAAVWAWPVMALLAGSFILLIAFATTGVATYARFIGILCRSLAAHALAFAATLVGLWITFAAWLTRRSLRFI